MWVANYRKSMRQNMGKEPNAELKDQIHHLHRKHEHEKLKIQKKMRAFHEYSQIVRQERGASPREEFLSKTGLSFFQFPTDDSIEDTREGGIPPLKTVFTKLHQTDVDFQTTTAGNSKINLPKLKSGQSTPNNNHRYDPRLLQKLNEVAK